MSPAGPKHSQCTNCDKATQVQLLLDVNLQDL